MTPEEQDAALRFMASFLELQAARLRLEAVALRATAASDALVAELRKGALEDERELLSFHPDVIELDLEDAAWNPE